MDSMMGLWGVFRSWENWGGMVNGGQCIVEGIGELSEFEFELADELLEGLLFNFECWLACCGYCMGSCCWIGLENSIYCNKEANNLNIKILLQPINSNNYNNPKFP